MKKYAVGADIGGHHVKTAIIDLENFQIVDESEVYIEIREYEPAETILAAWAEAINTSVEKAINHSGIHLEAIEGVGLAIPGPFDYEDGISLMKHKFRSLYIKNIREELAIRTYFKADNIKFKNDAESFLLGAVLMKQDSTIKEAIGVTLGTGFGSASYSNGNSKDANLWCAPYKGGIAEDFISTRWFVKRYFELAKKEIKGSVDLYNTINTDPYSKQIFNEFGETLRDFLLPLVIETKADTLVMGGNINKASKYFIGPLEQELAAAGVKLIIAEETEIAALAGAGSLLKNLDN
jgi:glucokinase